MSLRFKMNLAVFLIFTCILVILFVVVRPILMKGFQNEENRVVQEKVTQAAAVLNENLRVLEGITTDWAMWDDTYEFIQDGNEEYRASNLVDSTFINNNLSIRVYINSSGKIVEAQAYDLMNESLIPFPENLMPYISPDSTLIKASNDEGIKTGIIDLPEAPLLIAAHPILTSLGEGPSRGTLIFGRYLDDQEILAMKQHSGITDDFEVRSLSNTSLPADYTNAERILNNNQIAITVLGRNSIAGYTFIPDINDQPLMILKIETARPVMTMAQQTLNYFLWSSLFVFVALACILVALNEKLIVTRLSLITRTVRNIGNTSSSARVSVGGKDELSLLSASINGMLDRIQEKETALQQNYRELQETFDGAIKVIAGTLEMRDAYTAGHQVRVAQLAKQIALDMSLSEERANQIYTAALIHDIGKIGLPAEILSKPTELSSAEFSLIQEHPRLAYDVLMKIKFPYPLHRWILEHHERMNGSGYPAGLSGDNISLEARIIAVADVVEAITSHRPYRPALGIQIALEEISNYRVTLYDPAVVDSCIQIFKAGFTF